MTIKTLLTTTALTFAAATSGLAMGCHGEDHESASISCAQGTAYDAASKTCKVVSG